MSLARFISNKLNSQSKMGGAQPIVWIAKGGIIVGMMMMIISMGLVGGFQKEIQQKLTHFGGHLNIHSNFQSGGDMSTPFDRDDSLEAILSQHPLVKKISPTAHLPAILESKNGIQGVVLKGIAQPSDTLSLHDMMAKGKIPAWSAQLATDTTLSIVISQFQAAQLGAGIGEKLSIYFLNNSETPQQQNFTISGIYESGLEEFDRQIVFISLPQLLKYSHFGIEIKANVDSVQPNQKLVSTYITGAKGPLTTVWKIGSNIYRDLDSIIINLSPNTPPLTIIAQDDETLSTDSITVVFKNNPPSISFQDLGGAAQRMIGSYEIELHQMEDMLTAQQKLYELLPYDLGIQTVTEKFPEIISWLSMLDINVIIIIVMMIAISIINMTSALLIIIIERQQMIGTLKALGMKNSTLVQTFLYQSIHIISRGMLWGNGLGIVLLWLQKQFQWITLDPQQYFVKVVPVELNITSIILLNALVLFICIIAMLIPAAYSTRIQPIKSIKFN